MPNLRYKIKYFAEEQDIAPEETLADSLSRHPVVETPISSRVAFFFVSISIVVFSFFVFRAFQLQVVRGERFALLAKQATSSVFPLSPIRGVIFDAKSRPLVQNKSIFQLVAIRPHFPKSQNELTSVARSLGPVLKMDEPGLINIFEKNKDAGAFIIKEGLTKTEVLLAKEFESKGIFVAVNARRDYLYGPAAAHLLGYTSFISQEELDNNKNYSLNDRIGRLGLEAQYEDWLKGERRFFNPADPIGAGNKNKSIGQETAHDLILNIDAEAQEKLYVTMRDVFSSAGVKRGAAIVQNPKTGAVIAILSMPSFDNNIFEESFKEENSEKIRRLLSDPNRPLLNRAIGGRYSPGSTIKPLLALAGLKEVAVTPATLVYADGAINIQSEVDPSVFYTFRDWKVHGWSDIKKAIADSVDIYFYALGGGYRNIKGLGIDKISQYLKIFRTDQVTEIDLPGEAKGFVPTREWKKEIRGEGWYTGDNYNISIGQGDLLVTPIWLNTYIGAIANGGKLMRPQIVKEIKDANGSVVKETAPIVDGAIPFDKDEMDIVRAGMRQAVLSGTSTLLKDLPVPMAAKTGTAQVSGRGLNSLFSVWGPYDNPGIVMTVLVENINQSQGLAIRVARDFLGWYFSKLSEN